MRWYVVHAYSGFEKQVMRALHERIDLQACRTSSEKFLSPLKKWSRCALAKSAAANASSFPGYVLVEMDLDDDSWHLVKETPKVLGFIGGKADQPAPITDAEAATILQRVQAG